MSKKWFQIIFISHNCPVNSFLRDIKYIHRQHPTYPGCNGASGGYGCYRHSHSAHPGAHADLTGSHGNRHSRWRRRLRERFQPASKRPNR